MATLRNKRKLAAVTRKIQDENPRNGQSRNTSVPRINEDYLTQLSEEIEGRITKKLSREFSRIESRISDALSKLDEVLSNQQIQTYSETVPGTFRNTNVENHGTNEDDSQSDPHPEGGLFRSQTTQNSGPEAGHYMVTGATREIRQCPDMVTGTSEEIRNGHDMVTAVQEEIPYCSSGISSGKQKKARSTSQPQFRSENTPATIEADQILLALQQLATNSNSANVNNNSNRIRKLPKSLTTIMPTFDGKSEKFQLFEDLFQTSLKIHNPHPEGGLFRSQTTQNSGPEAGHYSRVSKSRFTCGRHANVFVICNFFVNRQEHMQNVEKKTRNSLSKTSKIAGKLLPNCKKKQINSRASCRGVILDLAV